MGVTEFVNKTRDEPYLRTAWAVVDVARMAGGVLRALRGTSRTQLEIGKELDLTQPRMSQIESGKVEHLPPLALMARYAMVCGDGLYLTTKSQHEALERELEEVKNELAKANLAVDELIMIAEAVKAKTNTFRLSGVKYGFCQIKSGSAVFRPLGESAAVAKRPNLIKMMERQGINDPAHTVFVEEIRSFGDDSWRK